MAQHISVRIPWKDNGYQGLVCDKPCFNNSCLRLKNIYENRDDEFERGLAGRPVSGNEQMIPCVGEGGVFMSEKAYKRTTVHPYKESNPETHGHFLETEVIFPPYSLPARPFSWMMRTVKNGGTNPLFTLHKVDYDLRREPVLSFEPKWVQDAVNQRAIFEKFYSDVTPRKSLVVAYAKQVPFVEDAKRVVMGIGFVEGVAPPPDYRHTGADGTRSILWETMVGHSIRDDRRDGFLLPYREMMEYAERHPGFDMRSVTVFAEDDYFAEFSYATEHVSYDAVINVLLQTLKVLGIVKERIPEKGNWHECAAWARERLREVWLDRGAYPGLGAMLCAAGFRYGMVVANEIKKRAGDGVAYEEFVENTIRAPQDNLPPDLAASIGETERQTFLNLPAERKKLFWLLSRLSLSVEQAVVLFHDEYRGREGIRCSDREIIENPYLLYERTRTCADNLKVSVLKVDMAVFPPAEILEKYPLPPPSALDSENDRRRIRAIAVSVLEKRAEAGHTVYPQDRLVIDINDLPIEPGCRVSGDVFRGAQGFLESEMKIIECAGGGAAYQLERLAEIDDVIRRAVDKRVDANRHDVAEDWKKLVDGAFGECALTDSEKRAREEKAAILKEIAEARLSVLAGGAGTGKTTLLSLLCKSPQISNGGVLLLAPTGKARVRMGAAMRKQGISFTAKTVAQFLIQNGRFDFNTMRYRLSNREAQGVPTTVIIDESSMLTEEMFGALMQALRAAQRIIFVGDPNQLPPIGAGRPFVDLVRRLKKDIPEFPRVGKSYGELTVTRRQQNEDGETRDDAALAEWYSDAAAGAERDDEIFARLQGNLCGKNIQFKPWSAHEELQGLILTTVAEEAGMKNVDDIDGFNISLGGDVGDYTYFNIGCAESAEKWQILAPVKNMPHGAININRMIHTKYRADFIETAKKPYRKKIKKPQGPEGIVYGDKVINVINGKRKAYPDNGGADDYVANGEIGIAGGFFGMREKFLNVEFSSQPEYTYSYEERDFGEEREAALELAYALTVHKAQGSEFDRVILVISEPCGLLSKELLYTAITRQSARLVILYNKEAYHLRTYASKACSDIARRFTCLFEKPEIVEHEGKYYEQALIHKTLKGEMVRSKSEVIVANMLHEAGIGYEYEKEITLEGDGRKIPDFTIDDAESGKLFYWEHCGMLANEEYRRRWEKKREIYKKHGIVEGENLIVSKDEEDGSIDSQKIKELIKRHFG